LDYFYPSIDIKKQITILSIREKDLKGSLKIEGFSRLERLDYVDDNQLTKLEIKNCPRLRRFFFIGTLKQLVVTNCPNLI
jgi:hypothetical protein